MTVMGLEFILKACRMQDADRWAGEGNNMPRAMIKGQDWLRGALRRTDMAMTGSVSGRRWGKSWTFSVESDGLKTQT